ncbi:hypothetical protein Tsubulata_013033 [Turnera subulata]|uniref:CUE domain-containing protein n=1 Tax=Turnera subulata TaxID=218843 RepID=A0A9Q0GBP4_9ROSI|nr:hypothetical protein Tsubulata_013033 [Turnera subulata]
MSAVVCGSKRSYFFEEHELPSPPLTKRLRCSSPSSSSSPGRFSLLHLKSIFPESDPQLIERVLQECGYDLDSAIRSLQEQFSGSAEEVGGDFEQEALANDGDVVPVASENAAAGSNLPVDGREWVDLFVREMMGATSVDDAKARASRVLEVLEKSISSRAAEESAQSFEKENMMLKEKIEVLIRENSILKRAVAIQHERQKDFEDKNRELEHLKQLVAQYQEQLRTLEVNNYALSMHLRQAQQSSTLPGRFNPDVF